MCLSVSCSARATRGSRTWSSAHSAGSPLIKTWCRFTENGSWIVCRPASIWTYRYRQNWRICSGRSTRAAWAGSSLGESTTSTAEIFAGLRGSWVVPDLPERVLTRRKALEHRQLVDALHPADALGDLDVRLGRDGVRVVIGAGLDGDDPGLLRLVHVVEAGSAIGAEMASAILRFSVV